ncbi:MAG: hypothetical protein K8S13_00595 [Desulfobacula sp.]|uniref:hypothetical protein n=1 Tax=Desulfobacula sp. TaxID=2593537 RepID=UPI0025B93A06|nr:hypothetical protein [Desulfobacula sp.]MCD4718346.1 hypothetical protein [Desulfobacula sp.]
MKRILFKTFFYATIVGFISMFHLYATAENIDPSALDSQYAYGENVGWFNAEPLGNGGPGTEVEDTKLTGYIWAENIGWVSLSCENTNSCLDGITYGIDNDGEGNLSGYAWGENVGWINFAPTGGGVAIETATGEFSGTAWGENIGWISFRGENSIPFRMMTSWKSVVNNCAFDSDDDGDVDGSDLAHFVKKFELESLIKYAFEFGRADCFD